MQLKLLMLLLDQVFQLAVELKLGTQKLGVAGDVTLDDCYGAAVALGNRGELGCFDVGVKNSYLWALDALKGLLLGLALLATHVATPPHPLASLPSGRNLPLKPGHMAGFVTIVQACAADPDALLKEVSCSRLQGHPSLNLALLLV